MEKWVFLLAKTLAFSKKEKPPSAPLSISFCENFVCKLTQYCECQRTCVGCVYASLFGKSSASAFPSMETAV